MNSLKNALLLVSVAISLVGCASGPTFAEYSAKQRPVASGQGRVWFYRPSKIVGAAVQPSVLVNDVKVGKAQPGCFFFIDRDPGTYEAKCTTEWSHKAKINLLARDEKFLRLAILPGLFVGHIVPQEVNRATGLKEIGNCKLITADGANAEPSR